MLPVRIEVYSLSQLWAHTYFVKTGTLYSTLLVNTDPGDGIPSNNQLLPCILCEPLLTLASCSHVVLAITTLGIDPWSGLPFEIAHVIGTLCSTASPIFTSSPTLSAN